ncbi:TPA: translation elongation factor Ts [Candidatus Amesbacteria bacterium]|nr:translation elongation factor Ts [Candidatus Amesbacteria bacterium]
MEDIKKLREMTSAGVSDCRMALEESGGDFKEAVKLLRQKGLEKADRKSEREVKAGIVFAYVHHTGRLGALAAVACETDFVAKTDDFQKLGRELAMQAAATKPANVEELLEQEYIRDPGVKVADLIKETIGKLGENIRVTDFRVVEV